MSSPAQAGPSTPAEQEKKGIGKVLSRMKTVLKKADPSRRLSKFGSKKASPGPAAPTAPEPAAAPSEPAKPTAPPGPSGVEPTKVPRAQLFEERAKKLGEHYGLELKPSEWHSTEGHALRVEKPIRMRVHRKCCQCSTSFGLGKECPKCKHQRCKKCPRVPPKLTEAEREERRKHREAMQKKLSELGPPIIADWDPTPKKIVLTRPSKTGGQDLVYKKVRMRIRRTCCQCQRTFISKTKTCAGCQHTRCTDCPGDQHYKAKYPYGYPADAPGSQVAHYQCPECKHIFSAPPSDEATCVKCSHSKVERLTPRKVEPEPDPEVLKRVQEKLAALRL